MKKLATLHMTLIKQVLDSVACVFKTVTELT